MGMSNHEFSASDDGVGLDHDSSESILGHNTPLQDSLEWLDNEKKWTDLTPAQQQRLLNQVNIDRQPSEVFSERSPYIPPATLMNLEGILHDLGVVDAHNLDAEFVRDHIGTEELAEDRFPLVLDEAMGRIKDRLSIFADDDPTAKNVPIYLADVASELRIIKEEQQKKLSLDANIVFLTDLGFDEEQLETMSESESGIADICMMASMLMAPSSEDFRKQYRAYYKKKEKSADLMNYCCHTWLGLKEIWLVHQTNRD